MSNVKFDVVITRAKLWGILATYDSNIMILSTYDNNIMILATYDSNIMNEIKFVPSRIGSTK
jgi:hypothetical protein